MSHIPAETRAEMLHLQSWIKSLERACVRQPQGPAPKALRVARYDLAQLENTP